MPKPLLLLQLLVATLALAPLAAAGPTHVSLTLDWTPNPDHIGFYYARAKGLFAQAGLDVAIRAPSDPTAPLKLVAVGASDLAVSYEQELFFAAAKHLPVVAVAAVVPRPLNSIMAISAGIRTVADLNGRTIGITGVPADYAALDTALAAAHLKRTSVKVVSVGYNLLPALLAHKVDAVLGVYRNVEGIELQQRGLNPTVIPLDQAGVPTYDELILVANSNRLRTNPAYQDTVSRFVQAFLRGTDRARHDAGGSLAILRSVTSAEPKLLARSTRATLALLAGPRGTGCLAPTQWQRFGAWMHTRNLLARALPAAAVLTTRFLPARCNEP
jgi:putative hydroxymethylpyrimidine transport system substrate-binding protein